MLVISHYGQSSLLGLTALLQKGAFPSLVGDIPGEQALWDLGAWGLEGDTFSLIASWIRDGRQLPPEMTHALWKDPPCQSRG